MQPMTPQQIAQVLRGVLWGPQQDAPAVTALSTDSRSIAPGCLFVPLTGPRWDGHDFIDRALEAGAAGCLCRHRPERLLPEKFYIKVPDTRLALGALAAHQRSCADIPVVQITGSVGKTTTKEMMAAVLSQGFRVLKTPENLNNDIGVPLTLLDLSPAHQAAVIETGMNHFGEIAYLGSLVRPDIAVISNIGDAHIGNLGSREGILKAKCEIFQHLSPEGAVILNGDDALLSGLSLPERRVLLCGQGELCNVRIGQIDDRGVEGVGCTVSTQQDTYSLEIPAPGAYMVYPAAMAVAAGELLGLDRQAICRGVSAYAPVGRRMRLLRLAQGRLVLDDCYNASPQSVTAALEVLAKTAAERRTAVLGDMGELGALTQQAHFNAGALAAMLGLDLVIAIGQKAAGIAQGAADNGGQTLHFPTVEQALPAVRQALSPRTGMLIKASHAMGLEVLTQMLEKCYG